MRPRVLTLALAAAVAGSAAFAPACSNALEDGGEDDGALVGGDASGPEDDAVVLLVRDGMPLCTATLVAPNVLLTAHHCVGRLQTPATGSTQSTVSLYQPAEITVRMGSAPAEKVAAVVTKIFAPQSAAAVAPNPGPTALPDGGVTTASTRGLESTDLAALLVQPLDPTFERLTPRRVRQDSVSETDTVNVVGWNGTGAQMRLGALRRMKRASVDVLADATQRINVESPSIQGIAVTNKPREFVTEAVACKGDDGAPAFDTQGNLVGFAAAVVGPCEAGSLSIFTDVAAHKSFIASVLSEVQRLACSSDSKCGTVGKICDTATFTCRDGCRVGSSTCVSGARCSSPSETSAGVAGTCSNASGPGVSYDGGTAYGYDSGTYVPEGDGGAGGSCTDRGCGGTTTQPKVCDGARRECVAGCRVGASPSMCGAGYDCKAGAADPTIGQCEARSVTAPPPPALALPARPNETVGEPAGVSNTTTPSDSDAGKKKNKAKAEEGGCTVGALGATSGVFSAGAAGWLAAAAAIAAFRRRKRG